MRAHKFILLDELAQNRNRIIFGMCRAIHINSYILKTAQTKINGNYPNLNSMEFLSYIFTLTNDFCI